MNNNFDRLYTVELFKKLNYNRLQEFHDIVELAAEICGTPIALITLLDSETNHFVAKVGIDMNNDSLEASFCQYTILQNDVLIVNDTLKDLRFIENPKVTDLGVRFYAGAALKANNGHKIGSLCVIDVEPKNLTPLQIKTLEILSRQATMLMELELAQKLLTEQLSDLETQNKKLMNIAQVHSHEFRRPVASLLGLMNIISDEKYIASKQCLLMMEEAVKELDEKIHMVVEYTQII
ncbi:MAG: GAF domain-containing protein [Flavipsychrobacter sp.]|nr:GAF domain-containing protein [Flavipsychrobacter sp.]